MTATLTRTEVATQPPVLLRALAGMAAALAAVGVGHGVAGLVDPVASPILAVGSVLIDAAPRWAKEFAVRTFGSYDKPILIGSIGVVLMIFAAALGLIAWRRRWLAIIGISLLGVAGLAAAVVRGSLVDGIPSLAAGVVGVLALTIMSRPGAGRTTTPAADRRRMLTLLAGVTVLAAVGGAGGYALDRARQARLAALRALGLPMPASPAAPLPAGVQVEGVSSFVTPLDEFYRVDISLVTPRVDASGWSLRIDGMVDNALTLSYDDLLALPLIERYITLTCVSNEVGGPYVSTGRWLGVPFREIITRVGVHSQVDQVFSYSSDSGYTASTPYAAVNDGRDAMIAIGLNGEPLPDARGFPARMLVPGLYGFVSATKWLERIEFTTYADRTAYWTQRDWATDAPVLTQCRIEIPKSLSTLPRSKPVIAGLAWAQHRGIDKVEIRIDDGEWQDVQLAADGGIDLWRQWSYRYDGPPGLHSAQVRATDRTGATQPEERTKVFPRGATGWHQIQFTAE
jgi:DMSO/TMAO reductase YedYZ molybdopterin-dependent catalytic subunit